MPVIKIEFFKVGIKVSTWMADDEWDSLDRAQKRKLIREFVHEHYPNELKISMARQIEPADRHYNWGEM